MKLNTRNQELVRSDFIMHVGEPKVNSAVWKFCAHHGVMMDECDKLLSLVMKSLRDIRMSEGVRPEHGHILELLRSGESSSQNRPPENLYFESYIGKDRHEEAFRNEIEQVKVLYKDVIDIGEIFDRSKTDSFELESSWTTIYAKLESRKRLSFEESLCERIAFIHSASFKFEGNKILAELLDSLSSSGLLEHLQEVWVVNHGVPISSDFKARYPENLSWIEHSNFTGNFEIPTLQLLHRTARVLSNDYPSRNTHVLYMHTKGVSYIEDKPSIRDWRRMMIYFLVRRHEISFHLLNSGIIDTVGVNFQYALYPHYWGNYFWATTQYLSILPVIAHGSSKYYAEHWLLSSPGARPYCLHNQAKNFPGVLNYTELLYPSYLYENERISDGYQPSLTVMLD
jgi:hypothetical protein